MKNKQIEDLNDASATKQADVFAPPKASLDKPQKLLPLYVDKKCVVASLHADWGMNCCYCNKKTQNTFTCRVTLQKKINFLYFMILGVVAGQICDYVTPEYNKFFPILTGIIISLALTFYKSTTHLNFPVCERHSRLAPLFNKLSTIVFNSILIIILVVYWFWDTDWALMGGFLLLFVIGPVLGKYHIRTLTQNDELYWFYGIGKEFRDKLPKYEP